MSARVNLSETVMQCHSVLNSNENAGGGNRYGSSRKNDRVDADLCEVTRRKRRVLLTPRGEQANYAVPDAVTRDQVRR